MTPAVNQIEVSPYNTRAELCAHCRSRGIVVECYSPLTRGQKLGDPKLVAIARRYKLSAAQLLIRWCVQKGYVVIPKSVTPARIEANMQLGDQDIAETDMAALEALDCYLVTGWDPVKSR